MLIKRIFKKSPIPKYFYLSDKTLDALYANVDKQNPESGPKTIWIKKLW